MYEALRVLYVQAPGYFQVVQRGMDFTTMRSKVQGDAYTTWQDFQVSSLLLQHMSMTWSASAVTHALGAAVASSLALK